MKRKLAYIVLGIVLLFPAACSGPENMSTIAPTVQTATPLPSADDTENTITIPPSVEIPIKFQGNGFEPGEIVLYVGQEITLTMTNTDTVSHDFVIGRNVVIRDGAPVGFETDFFADVEIAYDMEGGNVLFLPSVLEDEDIMTDPSYQARFVGHPLDYHGEMAIFAPAGWPEGSKGVSIARLEIHFLVVEELVGEWEYACFADDGQHYLHGEKGSLVVKKP